MWPCYSKWAFYRCLRRGFVDCCLIFGSGFQPDHGLRPGNTWGNILIDEIPLLVVVCTEEQPGGPNRMGVWELHFAITGASGNGVRELCPGSGSTPPPKGSSVLAPALRLCGLRSCGFGASVSPSVTWVSPSRLHFHEQQNH